MLHLRQHGSFMLTKSFVQAQQVGQVIGDGDPILTNLFNSSSPGQNGQHFADGIFKRTFLNEKVWFLTKVSLKFVPKGPIPKSAVCDLAFLCSLEWCWWLCGHSRGCWTHYCPCEAGNSTYRYLKININYWLKCHLDFCIDYIDNLQQH